MKAGAGTVVCQTIVRIKPLAFIVQDVRRISWCYHGLRLRCRSGVRSLLDLFGPQLT